MPPAEHPAHVTHEEKLSRGDRVADAVVAAVGSWGFIIAQSVFLAIWLLWNGIVGFASVAVTHALHGSPWDAAPFILLNLMLSFQAAFTGPVVLLSSNRQSAKDRIRANHDYAVNAATALAVAALLRAHPDINLPEVEEALVKAVDGE